MPLPIQDAEGAGHDHPTGVHVWSRIAPCVNQVKKNKRVYSWDFQSAKNAWIWSLMYEQKHMNWQSGDINRLQFHTAILQRRHLARRARVVQLAAKKQHGQHRLQHHPGSYGKTSAGKSQAGALCCTADVWHCHCSLPGRRELLDFIRIKKIGRILMASFWSQWAAPDLKHELSIALGIAGPQPPAPVRTGQCSTSTARKNVKISAE